MKYFFYSLFILASIPAVEAVNQFLFCPQYEFQDFRPFRGSQWYNPYDSLEEKDWIKCNFHAHTNTWNGLTNGKGNSEDLHKAYTEYGYDVHCISEYQKISDDSVNAVVYLPAYEHGYNISKTHQLVIGAHHVLWLDYIFPQSLSNKQHILDRLSADDQPAIVLNHPLVNHGYFTENMNYLNHYHCIEVLNPAAISTSVWDEALSSGHPVFITANDDVHNIFNSKLIGRFCTWLNVSSKNKNEIIHALKTGRGYGMKTGELNIESIADRMQRIKNSLPLLKSEKIHQDTLELKLNRSATDIRFIGNHGTVNQSSPNADSSIYILKPGDQYIRIQASFADGAEIYLNPVFRYDQTTPISMPDHKILKTKSVLYFITGILLLAGWCWTGLRYVWKIRLS